jgi:8-oxo-dGTP diphosphatase
MDHTQDDQFQVSVKGLFFNDEHKLLMIQEQNGMWELPGGRIQKGEQFIDCLRRECLEEIGLEPEVLHQQPALVYPAIDKEGRGRIVVFYTITFANLNFTPTEECVAIKFFGIEEIKGLETYPQLKPLPDLLR